MAPIVRTLAAGLGGLWLAGAAAAQTPMDLGTLSLGIQQIQQNDFLAQSIDRDMALQDSLRRSGQGERQGQARRPAPTVFTPVAGTIVPAQLAAKDPVRRAEVERFFVAMIDDYHALARGKGAPIHDCARAASYLINNLFYIEAGGRDLTTAQMDGLRAQIYRAMGADPKFQAMSQRERQVLYESDIIEGSFLGAQFDAAKDKGDRRRMQELQATARRRLAELLGAPMERVRLTAEGVAIRH